MYKNGFSIITVTNRDYCIENMINNFLRQEFNDKELIIVINNDKINIEYIYKYINFRFPDGQRGKVRRA